MRPTLLAMLLTVVACSSGSPGEQAVAETGVRLGELRSGELTLRMVVGPLEGDGGQVGFELSGPFQTGEEGSAAELTYTQFVDGTEQTTTFLAVDGAAYVEVDGTAYVLEDAQAGEIADIGALTGLDLSAWMMDPELVSSDDGVDRVEARLDAAAVLRDVVTMGARIAGADALGELGAADAEQIRAAARDASAVLETSTEDRVLRRLSGRLDLRPAADLGLPGGRMEIELAVDRPNEPVRIQAPSDARPIAELQGGAPS